MTQATSDTKPYAPDVKEHTAVVVRLGEITLKKKNRPMFVRQLGRNIRTALKGLSIRDADWTPQRIVITPGPNSDWEEIRDRLQPQAHSSLGLRARTTSRGLCRTGATSPTI